MSVAENLTTEELKSLSLESLDTKRTSAMSSFSEDNDIYTSLSEMWTYSVIIRDLIGKRVPEYRNEETHMTVLSKYAQSFVKNFDDAS